LHVAYVAGGDVYYARSTDNGKIFSAPIRVNSEAGAAHPAGMYRGPDLAVGKGGQVHVIWYSDAPQRELPKEQRGVFYSRLNPERSGFAPARNLNHRPSDNFSLAADGESNVAVFWMADARLFVNLSADGGQTFSPAAAVAGADTCECCASRAFFSGGALYAAYRDKAGNFRDMYLATRPSRQAAFRREKISVTPWQIDGCPMTGTSLTAGKNGPVMAWETKGYVFFARLDGSGRNSSRRETRASEMGAKWPVVLMAPDGVVLVSWKKGSAIEWQLFDADDKPLGNPERSPSRNPHRHAGVVTKEGDFLLVD
jgi:hypothetical protein